MKNFSYFIVILLLNSSILFSQVAINTDGCAARSSAILDVKSTSKGVLIPSMSFEQRNAITNPDEGLLVFCTDCGAEGSLSMYSKETWKTFSPCISSKPIPGVNVTSPGQIVWNWSAVDGATGYKWNTVNFYSTAIDMGTGCSKTETGISGNTDYTRYIWSYNACSNSAATNLTETTYASAPVTPACGTLVPSINQIVWNWSTVTDATGYKWNTINDYECAIDMGTSTTITETGLTCEISYTRYAWAYNGFGYSLPLLLTQTTLSCSSCGFPIIINHETAGGVAPVNKTVTYGTVSNIPGETTKCWITSNLGADHQETSKSDNTEASAGWYWQFDHAQGFKHDGTTRTPNNTWISSIDNYSNWIAANDPCALELDNGWRIPTNTEWLNVDASGGWINYNYPFSSNLKMHAAGFLRNTDAMLRYRGSDGAYWSSMQSTSTIGRRLYFLSSASDVGTSEKAFGYTLRCIKD